MIDLIKRSERVLRSAKPILRDAVAKLAARTGLTNPKRRARHRLTVVTFHRVLREAERRLYPLPGLVVTPEELSWFMGYFTSRYECGPLTELFGRWQAGCSSNAPLLAVTFDDGQRDNYENARPILNHFRVRASFYVPVTHIDNRTPIWHDRLAFATMQLMAQKGGGDKIRQILAINDQVSKDELVSYVVKLAKDLAPERRVAHIQQVEQLTGDLEVPEWATMMGWPELEELRDEGHEIGSHSLAHPILTQCKKEDLWREVNNSRIAIEKRLGVDVLSFCYPNGSYDTRVVSAVRDAGYRCAVTTSFGTNKSECSPYTLRRCDMCSEHARSHHGKLSQARLALRLSGLQPGLPK